VTLAYAAHGPRLSLNTSITKNVFLRPPVISEMLLQSQNGEIELLPALPRAWPSGSVKGLKARGGFEVSLDWHDGRLARASIHTSRDRPCLIRLGSLTARFESHAGDVLELDAQLRRIAPGAATRAHRSTGREDASNRNRIAKDL
jgi:hypothetical protein